MAPPTSPYCLSSDVAALNITAMSGRSDFDATESGVKLARVNTMIGLVSGQVDMQMVSAGYVVPLAVFPEETWPTHQTTYLQLVCSLGVAAKVFSDLIAPAPHLTRSGGKLGNLYDEQYNLELRKIYDYRENSTRLRMRANWRPGTPVESIMQPPQGPRTDFERGAFDPTNTLSFEDVTELADRIQQAFKDLQVAWDYGATELDAGGLGLTTYEPVP